MILNFKTSNIDFKHPFTISSGTKNNQEAIIVSLENRGITGYGEAPAIKYYPESIESMLNVLQSKKPFIEKFAFTTPDRYWHYLHHLLPQNPFIVCALDMAAWDIFGKMYNRPLFTFFTNDIPTEPQTDFTIGIDSIEKMVAKIEEKPWPVYKIKLGTDHDIKIIEALRKHTDNTIRVDANAAWSLAEAKENITAFKDLNIELIEQPLAKDNLDEMQALYDFSPITLIADESCVSESDVAKCIGKFHGINIKLTKCSGITPALRMIKQAKENGLKTMLGGMNETSIGSAAVAHLSPLVDFLDMDGPLLLKNDIATGLEYTASNFKMPYSPGLGIKTTFFNID